MRVLLSGGGTGGHIYPALALARHISRRDPEAVILFVGTEKGLERSIVPAEGFDLAFIPASGYPRRLAGALPAGRDFFKGLALARDIIGRFRPEVVVGTGGYVSAPVVAAAVSRRLPAVIHEQNALPGMANRWLSPLAGRVCLSFEASRRSFPHRARTVFTGNPRASEVAAVSREEGRSRLNLDPACRTVLIYGGSRGAERINQVTLDLLLNGWLPPGMQLVYITGEIYYQKVREKLGRLPRGVFLYPYLRDMPSALAAADLAVTRSGATTLAELTALGVPALLVPSPNVVNNHQYFNARLLSDAGAALLVEEREFTALRLRRELEDLFRAEGRLEGMARAGQALGVPDAAERMYRCLLELLKNGSGWVAPPASGA